MLTKYPELGAERKDTIAIAQFVDGYYLEQFSECNKKDSEGNYMFVCMDPPPMALEVKVQAVIYGPKVPRKLTLATTDHFGFQNYDFENPQYFLIKIKSDGVGYVMPRYEKKRLALNVEGRYLMPVLFGEGVSWLPCSLKGLEVEINPSEVPVAFRTPIKEFNGYYLKQYPSAYVVSNDIVTPRHFIYVDEIAQSLEKSTDKELSECEE